MFGHLRNPLIHQVQRGDDDDHGPTNPNSPKHRSQRQARLSGPSHSFDHSATAATNPSFQSPLLPGVKTKQLSYIADAPILFGSNARYGFADDQP